MKINPVSGAVHFLNEVKRRQDGEGSSQNQHQSQQQKKEEPDPEPLPFDEKLLSQAVEGFTQDNTANGLNAAVQGGGPGLKIVLKDGGGAVVRQFTGEEFLKLREAASQDSRKRGKILDQKF